VHFLVDLACAQDDAEEQDADIESEDELKDATLASSKEDGKDLERCH
jgi:hypothetical protein